MEQVTEFVYMGSLIMEDGQCTKDIKCRIDLTSAMSGKLRKMWKTTSITTKTKINLYTAFVTPVLMYGPER